MGKEYELFTWQEVWIHSNYERSLNKLCKKTTIISNLRADEKLRP